MMSLTMDQVLKCRKCDYQLTESVKKCPICGTVVITTGRIRVLGGIQLVIGLFLFFLMGTITISLLPMMAGGRDSGFSGTQGQAALILLLFGVIIILGLTSIANGVFQLATGRRNKWIFVVALLLGLLIIVLGVAVRTALGG